MMMMDLTMFIRESLMILLQINIVYHNTGAMICLAIVFIYFISFDYLFKKMWIRTLFTINIFTGLSTLFYFVYSFIFVMKFFREDPVLTWTENLYLLMK